MHHASPIPHRTIIIGAGLAGLSIAALLARSGYDVLLLEKNAVPGGRAMSREINGFRFDMGPSWYLMPEVFERYFATFGKTPSDYYSLKRLDPAYQVFTASRQGPLQIMTNLAENMALFERLEPGGSRALQNHLQIAAYFYELAIHRFLYRPFRKASDFLSLELLFTAPRLKLFSSLDHLLRRSFRSEIARQLLSYPAVFLGADPRRLPALYALMSHVDFSLGVFYPNGGMSRVVEAITSLCSSLGVRTFYNTEVTGIHTSGDKAQIARTSAGDFTGDVFVSAADYAHTELDLLPQNAQSLGDHYWSTRILAPSAFIMYLGVKGRVPGVAHHNLYFQEGWEKHFNAIFNFPSWPSNPSYYFCVPTQSDPEVAPKDCENIFILVPVASELSDSDAIRASFADAILSHLENLLHFPIRKNLLAFEIFSQRDFRSTFNAYRGTALGLAHTLRQTALLRPPRRSKKLKNLFFTGQYTEPGIGLPMTLISSTLTAEEIQRAYSC